MPKNKLRVKYKFKNDIRDRIENDGVLLIRLSNSIGGEMNGLCSMIKRNSQTLMHILVLETVSERLKVPIKELYEKIK